MGEMVASLAAAALLATVATAAGTGLDPHTLLLHANWPLFERITEKIVASNARSILDIGTGLGQPAMLMAEIMTSANVTAVDIQAGLIQEAKSRATGMSNLHFRVSDSSDLSAFPADSFDVVTMSHVLMFVDDRGKSLSEMARVLRQDGIAFLSVWKSFPLLNLSVESFQTLPGASPEEQLSVNPLALMQDGAVEDLVKVSRGLLEVESSELLDYPMNLGTAGEACEAGMTLVGPLVRRLAHRGQKDAEQKFCSAFLELLAARGMKQAENGIFEVPGCAAQLLVIRKLTAASKHLEL
eukprot:TRINITY_DN68088_c0_g1_i1.p1 TRINITY_DN68088_c0_g1~~TRINITY_DN68088_c0_g1_i1.p1  ORF type:complete len:306 (+),score=59.52 TRINITY_DN68088_c0_g1_i1:29-919(+)